jgi:hypothetical protein
MKLSDNATNGRRVSSQEDSIANGRHGGRVNGMLKVKSQSQSQRQRQMAKSKSKGKQMANVEMLGKCLVNGKWQMANGKWQM